MDIFEFALDLVLDHEGGYVNDPEDPGGETIYGISRRAHPEAWESGRPTKAKAAEIYRSEYWDACRCDDLPSYIAIMVFDTAVNTGCAAAVRMLQSSCGAVVDGIIGPKTIAAANNADPDSMLPEFVANRVLRYASLKTWSRFGRGWTRRTSHVAIICARMTS